MTEELLVKLVTLFISTLAFVISFIALNMNLNRNARDHMYHFKNRLLELSKMSIEQPDILQFIYSTEVVPEYFFDPKDSKAIFYIRVTGFILYHLGSFDFIIDVLEKDRKVKKTVDYDA